MSVFSKLSSDELHQFKTGVLAEQRAQERGMDEAKSPLPDNGQAETAKLLKHDSDPNYILHLNAFFAHSLRDPRLKSNHISLYIALFYFWNLYHFRNPFMIYREQVMRVCKIRSRNTYTQCLKWLHVCGYIDYQPAGVLYQPSMVSIHSLMGIAFRSQQRGTKNNTMGRKKNDTRSAKNNDTHTGIKNDTGDGVKNNTVSVSNLIHNYNNKQINYETESKQARTQKKLFSNEKKEQALEVVTAWFSERGQTAQEARKFFYHYEAINWTLSGQRITDWQAAAFKWLENVPPASKGKPGTLHTVTNKNYNKPL